MFCLYVHYSFTLELLNIVNYIISLNYTMLKPSFRIGRSNVLSTNFVPLSCLRCFGVLLKPMCLFPFCFLRNNPDAVTENRPFHELYPFIFVDVLDILTFWEVAYERAVVVVVVVVVVVNVVGPMEDRATVVDGGFEAKEKKDDAKRVAMLFSAFPLAVAASPLNNVLVKVAADNEAYDVPADVVAPYEEEVRKARSSVLLNMLFFSACVGKKCSFFSLSLSLSQLSNKNRSFKGAIYCARAIRMKYVTKLKVLVATATFTSTATTVGGTSDDLGKRTVPVQFVFFFLSRFDCGG